MIHDHDRSGWIGASDTSKVMGRWDTETFRKWWSVKLGIRQETFTTPAMQAGTAYEGKILDALGIRTRDRQVRIHGLRLRVNYDGEDARIITEVKTHSKAEFRVSKAYWQQCQVEMLASGWGLRRRKECRIAAYRMTEADIQNYFLPIDMGRMSFHPIPYDEEWVERAYLPRLRYLAKCLKTGQWPREEAVQP